MVKSKKSAVLRIGTAFTAAALALPLLSFTPAGASKVPSGITFPRNETLYTSGTAYGAPGNFNPLDAGARYTGTMGLLYEPLFLYNPVTNKYMPWLATAGSWHGSTYTIYVRNGVKWTDGAPLTGADVAYTINLAKTNPAVPWSNLVQEGLKGATASGNVVKVSFSSPPPYTAWQSYLWNQPVLPEAVWSKLSATDQVAGTNAEPVSTGPMTLVPGQDWASATQACYQDNPNWWGTAQLGLKFHFRYLCDVVNGSNNVELSALLQGNIDWSNNFLPGINTLIKIGGNKQIKTYYPTAPYMLSANTAWLEMNTQKAPMSNLWFRKAVAAAINPSGIVQGVYSGIVRAANPVGLLPNLTSWVNKSVVAKYGFSYNPAVAKADLAKSGYKGQSLTLAVPDGWTDWMAAIQVIASDLNAVGINVHPIYPKVGGVIPLTGLGNSSSYTAYDMIIDNNAQPDSTPWSYFNRVFALPVGGKSNEEAAGLNLERFTDPAAFALVKKAAVTPLSDTSTLQGIYSQLETMFLQNLPEIPLWYNGAWFQGNTTYWQGYPSATNPSDNYTPVMWGGWLGAMTTVYALADLHPAA